VASFFISLLVSVKGRPGLLRASALVLAAFSLGAGWAVWHSGDRLAERLPAHLEGQRLAVSGYVCDLPVRGNFNSIRFSFCVTGWPGLSENTDNTSSLPSLLRLSWYGYKSPDLPARLLQLEVVLKRPHGSLNLAGFRYEDWLFRNGYRATGTVKAGTYDPNVPCHWRCQYHWLHAGLVGWVTKQFSGTEHFPLIASLLVGYRGNLSPSDWDTLKATGTIHLVAISGLHLGLIALGAGLLCRWLLLLVPGKGGSESQRRRTIFLVVAVCCVFYALAAGFTVPTRRALVMVIVGGWSILCAHQAPVWRALTIALGVVLLTDPFAPLDQGFWLSFAAVAILVCVFAGRTGQYGWLASLAVAQCAIFAGLWPVLGVFDQQQPVAGAVANLFAIPWVSFVVMPVLITGGLLTALLPSLSGLVGQACDGVLSPLWMVLSRLADYPFPAMTPPPSELAALAALVVAVIVVPVGRFRLVAVMIMAMWAAMAVSQGQAQNPSVGSPRLDVMDVGQGLSVLIRDGTEVLLYDTGPAVPGVFSAVESVLLPNLRAWGVRRIDTLVVSHADSDHSGGLALLVGSLPVGRIVSGEPEAIRKALEGTASPPVFPCMNSWESLSRLSIHYWQAPDATEGNGASCVIQVQHPASGTEWILPGDITRKQEKLYLAHQHLSVSPATRVIIAPHHGSNTSSSASWVKALMPDMVIYSAGYRHRFGHPHPDVTARYRQVGARQLNTACSGQLAMSVKDGRLTIAEMRQTSPFWIKGKGLARDECQVP
jgi:competence protein ComEC